MDLNNMFFHGLSGNIITLNSQELIIDTSVFQLEQIINTGGLYSRNILKKHNIIYNHKAIENTDDYISICIKNPLSSEFEGLNEGLESSFNSYICNDRISLIIDNSILKTHVFRNSNETNFLPGERQVKDSIELKHIIGILISFDDEYYQTDAINKVNDLLMKYGLEFPIFDYNFDIININNKIK